MDAKLQRWVQREGWNRAVDCYDTYWRRQLQPAIDLLVESALLEPGETVIEVACGTGAVALAAATAVGPTGHVVATDISPRMVAALRRRADELGVGNLTAKCVGAEQLEDRDRFEVGLCSLGLMYVPSPIEALARLRRAVVPGGRVVASVWGERRNCGWAELFPIVDRRVESDVCPMFFALGAPGALTGAFERAGIVDVTETRMQVDLVYADDDAALGAAFLGGPVALAYSRFDAAARADAHGEYLASIAPFADGAGYRVPGEFVVATGRRPDPPDRVPISAHQPTSQPTNITEECMS